MEDKQQNDVPVNVEGWKKTEYYCCYCGVKGLLISPGEGDFYVGPDYHCSACKRTFTMG